MDYALVCIYIVGKNKSNSMNHVGHVLNEYFNRTNPQWRRQCESIITLKDTCLIRGSTNITKFFLQVMCELKKAQLKRANTLSTNPSIGGGGEFVRLPSDEISDEIPRFASVQCNSIA